MARDETLLDLDERLRGDDDGVELRRLTGDFETARAEIARRLAAGVAPAEYRRLDAIARAHEAAIGVLKSRWEAHHPGEG